MDRTQALSIEQVMTPAPTCLVEGCTLAGALALLERERYEGVPVVDEAGELVGMLTRSAVLDWLSTRLQTAPDLTLRALMATPIPAEALERPVRCPVGARLKQASKLLLREESPAALVERDERVVGILTLQDVARAVAYGDEPAAPGVGQTHDHCFAPGGLPRPLPMLDASAGAWPQRAPVGRDWRDHVRRTDLHARGTPC